MSRHWHMGVWLDGQLAKNPAHSEHPYQHGVHGDYVEANGAYAHALPHVPGDPYRWVCFWACDIRHP